MRALVGASVGGAPGDVAQLEAHHRGTVGVAGSSPVVSTVSPACEHRWLASRIEVETAPVLHVCVEPAGHEGQAPHRCACGAGLAAPLTWGSWAAARRRP